MDSSKDSEQEEDDKKILKPILALPYNFAKKPKNRGLFPPSLIEPRLFKTEGNSIGLEEGSILTAKCGHALVHSPAAFSHGAKGSTGTRFERYTIGLGGGHEGIWREMTALTVS